MPKLIVSAFSAAFGLIAVLSTAAQAAELVMVELKSCSYCAKFNREMAPAYEASEIGKAIPLRRVNPRKWPKDLAGVTRAPYTPVFILVEDGREIGRFAGYGGPDYFNEKLSKLLARR